ncbi:RagB/SusD family nutrient uptake outer membrane protein [Aestuariibaculum suncheonense]|uniref:RagB/SusD family nutrient uptake outer membrane protein n=1 Tax=Aestuariibaculum suncheonense TaxID=1028745 RepID=A0A8J6QD36_9FLAO|nr:RagB/SusD family nutrient uptake outer membrane protein [Aestuariibaculum suncheonense]MBD0836935.1 RagB/SusD family nutrient uptake outer membrane protein [Aestuariibaculum suncheonense]
MKRFKSFKIYTVVVTLLSLVSCSDFLEREPVSITHPNVFWVNQANAEQAVAGSYALFKQVLMTQGNFLYWGEWTGMTFMDSRNWIVGYIEGSGNYNLAYRDASRDWKGFYRAANWAVTTQKYIEGMDDDLFDSVEMKNKLIGEAAFVQALSYFYMARIWGDVPIIEESLESIDQLVTEDGFIVSVPRSPELEVLDFAYQAVEKSISLLEYSSPGDADWAIRANKASAEALKAHIALWYASRDNDNSLMIDEAILATTNVINNSGANLIDYTVDGADGVERMCTGQSETGLFEVNISSEYNESFRVSTGDNNHTGLTLNAPFNRATVATGATPVWNPDFYGNEMMAQDADRVDDIRKDLFFYEYGTTNGTFTMKYAYSSQDPDSESAYALFSESNILIFRLADMYLLRAEANARLNKGTDAVNDINMIRSKANVPNYTGATDRASLMKAIFDERAIEFVGEAQSGYDRIRMNYFEGVSWASVSRNEKKGYFWPVHPNIISTNPEIIQTEYWQGRL